MINLSEIQSLQKRIKQENPLIHCITNPISIHDCANMILAVGARPIMAEHPKEAAEITASSQALMLNLGNITDARMESMALSLSKAEEQNIPVLLDLVGVTCSRLRFDFAEKLLSTGKISILKGNMSEMLAMAGLPFHGTGVDAGEKDTLDTENYRQICRCFKDFALKSKTVVLATGKTDLITDGSQVLLAGNGSEMLSRITGTGCQTGALSAAFLAGGSPFLAAALGPLTLGIAGEKAAVESRGTGSFQIRLLDEVYNLTPEELYQKANIRYLTEP